MHKNLCTRGRSPRPVWIVLLLLAALPGLPGAALAQGDDAVIGIEEIERGQRGYGLSVFEGSEVRRFEVEVVGVLRNLSPDQSYILARLEGQGLDETGVIRGMSGSPVYLDGRLAGAVAFSWDFSRGAIAGITPIDAMRRLQEVAEDRPLSWSATPTLDPTVAPVDVDAEVLRGWSAHWLLDPEPPAALLERELARLAPTPADGRRSGVLVGLSGFSGPSLDLFARHAAAVTPTGRADTLDVELGPGSSVAGLLIDGDLQATVSGTVTERDGDELLALGHPFLGLGPISLPLAPAEVVTVISNQASSFKLTNVGPVVGVFDQDRMAGLRGRLGVEPRTVPMTIEVAGEKEASSRRYALRLADLPLIAPSLVAMSMIEALDAAAHLEGVQSIELEASIRLLGHPELRLRQSFEGQGAGMSSAIYMLILTGFLVNNPWQEVSVEGIDLVLHRSAEIRSASLLAAHTQSTRVHPGDTVKVLLDLQGYRGERFRRSLEVEIPADQRPGPYYLFVGDGSSVDAARLQLEPRQDTSLEEGLALLRSFRPRDRLVALGFAPAPGLVVSGDARPELPATVRSFWEASSSFGTKRLALAIENEVEIVLDRPIGGLERLDLEVVRRSDAEGEEGR